MNITLSRANPHSSPPVSTQVPNTSVPAVSDRDEDCLELGGVKIQGLNLESIESAGVQISVPLNAGVFEFPALYAPAMARVSKDNAAFVNLKVEKGDNGKLKIKSVDISLIEPIVIENPASAFSEPPESLLGRAAHALKDRVAKLHVSGIHIDASGEVHFDGRLLKGGLMSVPLSELMRKEIPNLNLDIRHLASAFTPNQGDIKFGASFLKALGKIVGEAFYTAQVVVKPTSLSIHNGSIDFSTQEQGAKGELKGHITLNDALDLSVTADPNHSFIDSLLGRVVLGASLNIEHPLEPYAHVAFKVNGLINDLPKLDISGHRLNASSASFSAAGAADVLADHSITHGSGEIFCALKNPHIQVENTSVRLNGDLGANLTIRDLEVQEKGKAPAFNGNLAVFMKEAGRRRELELEFRLHKSGRVSTSPLHRPCSGLIDLPFHNAYPQRDSEPVFLGPLGRLTLVDFNRKMEKLTNSRITSSNHVELLVDGKESYPRRIALINSAKDSICLQTLIFQDDESGMVTARALAAAAKRGVKVYVIVDGQGAADDLKNVITENKAYKVMTEAGVELRVHNDAAISGLRDIIDVITENKLSRYSKEELVSGACTKLVAIICEVVIKLQDGSLKVSDDQRRKLVAGLNRGLGNAPDAPIDHTHLMLPTDSSGFIELSGLIDRAQAIIKQVYSWHEKHFIVDGQSAILGGMNISDPYMFGGYLFRTREGKISKGWRDTDLLIHGPAVDDCAAAFSKNWDYLGGTKLELPRYISVPTQDGGIDVQIIQHSPSISGDNHITDFLAAHLNRLEPGQSAYFENAYFCASSTLSPLFEAMINAAKRGVKVIILTNSEMTSDLPAINNAAFHTYDDLLKAGVRIFERSDDRTIHSKIAVLGDNVAIVGSANLDNRSARLNSEVIAAVYNEEFATRQRHVIEADLNRKIAREVTRDYLASISTVKRVRFAAMALIRDLC